MTSPISTGLKTTSEISLTLLEQEVTATASSELWACSDLADFFAFSVAAST